MEGKRFLARLSFSLGMVLLLAGSQSALAQGNRPKDGVPDITGPGLDGTQGDFQQSGGFVNTSRGNQSLGEIDDDVPPDEQPRRHFSFRVDRDTVQFQVWIFDGNTRSLNPDDPQEGATWDPCGIDFGDTTFDSDECLLLDPVEYTLYVDKSGPLLPSQVPAGEPPAASTAVIADTCGGLPCVFDGDLLPDNQWTQITVDQDPDACGNQLPGGGPALECGYHLVARWGPPTNGVSLRENEINNFKVGVSGAGTSVFVFDGSNLGSHSGMGEPPRL